MSPLDAFWHLANLLVPPWALAALLAAALKTVWWRSARALTWQRLWLWGGAGGTLALMIALVWLRRDGQMAGYMLLLLGVALPQWWLLSFRR